ncbi:hypothetical protein FISHEDRAFT_53303 [Fistulina hepatica ATCC 64428]|nr:hypothetical protein FISHEDRAFT_53303 [Fistulina hepatica ATCC 64428]
MLKAVSSRTLSPTTTTSSKTNAFSSSSSSAEIPVPDSRPAAETPSATPKGSSFQEYKQAREARHRVAGGIFRPDGKHSVVSSTGETHYPVASASSTSTTSTPQNESSQAVSLLPNKSIAPPKTLHDFTRQWSAASSDASGQWSILRSVEPAQLPDLFKTSLEPTLLVDIARVLVQQRDAPSDVRRYLEGVSRVPRISTILLFLSSTEKTAVKDALALAGVPLEGVWKVII